MSAYAKALVSVCSVLGCDARQGISEFGFAVGDKSVYVVDVPSASIADLWAELKREVNPSAIVLISAAWPLVRILCALTDEDVSEPCIWSSTLCRILHDVIRNHALRQRDWESVRSDVRVWLQHWDRHMDNDPRDEVFAERVFKSVAQRDRTSVAVAIEHLLNQVRARAAAVCI